MIGRTDQAVSAPGQFQQQGRALAEQTQRDEHHEWRERIRTWRHEVSRYSKPDDPMRPMSVQPFRGGSRPETEAVTKG